MGSRTVPGSEKGEIAFPVVFVNTVCGFLVNQVIDEEWPADMYNVGIPLEGPVGVIITKTSDISDFV